ncbi:MAG: IS3 family transposase, partial [Butyricicoccus porcorum]|nr:IS3 family transposase [Butyricicoccus porcorum]
INHHYYHSEKELYTSIEEFAYVHYNHERPHSYNNYKTPFEARYGA